MKNIGISPYMSTNTSIKRPAGHQFSKAKARDQTDRNYFIFHEISYDPDFSVDFFWEVSPFDEEDDQTSKIDSTAPEQQWSHFLHSPVTNNITKVPYINDFIPPFFRKSEEFTKNYKDFSLKEAQPMPEQKKGAIVLTYYRSGSSFIGQVLNQHPDVFYHFEPLYPFTRDCSQTPAYKQTKIETIEQILKCDLPNWRGHFMNTIPERTLLANDKICLYRYSSVKSK